MLVPQLPLLPLFSLLPLGSAASIHVPLSSCIMNELARNYFGFTVIPDFHATNQEHRQCIWNCLFSMEKINKISTRYSSDGGHYKSFFDFSASSDGVCIALHFKKEKSINFIKERKYCNFDSKTSYKEKYDFDPVPEVNMHPVCGVDTGRKYLVVSINENDHVYKCTTARYYHEAKINVHAQRMNEKIASTCSIGSSPTAKGSLLALKEQCRWYRNNSEDVWNAYSDPQLKQWRMNNFSCKQRALAK